MPEGAPGGETPTNGRAALEMFAPAPARALAALEAGAWRAVAACGRSDAFERAARVVAAQVGLPPLARPGAPAPPAILDGDPADWRRARALDGDERVVLGFAEQMAFDVASLGADERQAFFGVLGADAVAFAQALWVADFAPRVRAALARLFGPGGDEPAPPAVREADLAAAFDELLRSVPGLQALDPVTTEVVRLLGARRHRCRLCQSLRSRSAILAGADDATFSAVDAYATSSLSDARKAALAFADAMIASPFAVDEERARALAGHFAPEARVELVLDVARNASNKVAVALGGDAPHVEEGVEVYDVTPDGEIHFGLERPA